MENNFDAQLSILEPEGLEFIREADALHPTSSSHMKIIPSTPPKKSKRSTQKRVVSVPIKAVEGSRLKGDPSPPSDSWAWRKYGQKPIKGSPYPRGYYRCSSSKGCPARKQVERSREDPTMITITYTSEHTHTWPVSRSGHRITRPEVKPESEPAGTASYVAAASQQSDEFAWFEELETTSSMILESPMFSSENRRVGDKLLDDDVAMLFPTRELEEVDESLFADLGELPECCLSFYK